MIHVSSLPDVTIPDRSVTEHVLRHATRLGNKAAFIEGHTGRTLTYAELEAAVRSLAGGLVGWGLAKGDAVALLAPNLPEYAVIFHGVAFAGGVVTTINPTYTDREVHHQLVDARARLMVTVGAFLHVARAAVEGTEVTDIVVIDDAEGATPLSSLLGPPLEAQVPVAADDVVVLPYSSGTTGLSKGVMLTHANLVANIEQTLGAVDLVESDIIDAVLPLFHIYGMQISMNCCLAAGATAVMLPRFDLVQFLAMHQQYGVTLSFVVPPIALALARHPIVADYDLSALRRVTSAAAPLSAELAVETATRLGVDVVQGYGMTELSPVSHLMPPGRNRPGAVGVAAPNTEVRIVDPDTGADLDGQADGEVWIRGPQVMAGYLDNPEATAATIDADGWLHTGDLGHVDVDGYLFIADRLKELIKYKGFQVPPAELEGILLTHPAVADAAVVGQPDDEAGEIPVAFVVLKPGSDAAADDIRAFVNDQVAHFKYLARVSVIEAIPKSAAGKILRRELRT